MAVGFTNDDAVEMTVTTMTSAANVDLWRTRQKKKKMNVQINVKFLVHLNIPVLVNKKSTE